MFISAPCNQGIDAFFVSAAEAAQAFSLPGYLSRPQAGSTTSEAGGKYKLTYLHFKAGTITQADGLRH